MVYRLVNSPWDGGGRYCALGCEPMDRIAAIRRRAGTPVIITPRVVVAGGRGLWRRIRPCLARGSF